MDMGGGGGGGYVSPNIDKYEDATSRTIFNRLGAKRRAGASSGSTSNAANAAMSGISGGPSFSFGSPHYTYGTLSPNTPQIYGMDKFSPNASAGWSSNSSASGDYNFDDVGMPVSGRAGLETATNPFDFSPIDRAIAGFTAGPQKYDAFKFNFGSLPKEYTDLAYTSGASDINRAGADQLAQIRESIGVRRPGLLMKAGQQSQRDTSKNLLGLNTGLRLNEINQNIGLNKEQQMAQAGQNLAASQLNNSNTLNFLQGLLGAGQGKIGTQSGLLENERAYQDKAIQMLMNLYQAATGQANQAAQLDQNASNSAMNSLLGLGTMAAAFIPK